MEVSFNLVVALCVVVLIMLGWSIYVIRKDRMGVIQHYKNEARGQDGIVSREKFAELIYQAILDGKWEP